MPIPQACPVGEFGARLDLLHSFKCQLAAMAAQHPQQAVEEPQQVARWQQLAAVLYNVHRYYAQFRPHVEQQIGGELKQLEKELQVGEKGIHLLSYVGFENFFWCIPLALGGTLWCSKTPSTEQGRQSRLLG